MTNKDVFNVLKLLNALNCNDPSCLACICDNLQFAISGKAQMYNWCKISSACCLKSEDHLDSSSSETLYWPDMFQEINWF